MSDSDDSDGERPTQNVKKQRKQKEPKKKKKEEAKEYKASAQDNAAGTRGRNTANDPITMQKTKVVKETKKNLNQSEQAEFLEKIMEAKCVTEAAVKALKKKKSTADSDIRSAWWQGKLPNEFLV